MHYIYMHSRRLFAQQACIAFVMRIICERVIINMIISSFRAFDLISWSFGNVVEHDSQQCRAPAVQLSDMIKEGKIKMT